MKEALEKGHTAQAVLNDGLVAGMVSLGEDFSAGKAFVPEMLMAAKCMTAATDILKPLLIAGGAKSRGKVVLGTVKGDMHDIGNS